MGPADAALVVTYRRMCPHTISTASAEVHSPCHLSRTYSSTVARRVLRHVCSLLQVAMDLVGTEDGITSILDTDKGVSPSWCESTALTYVLGMVEEPGRIVYRVTAPLFGHDHQRNACGTKGGRYSRLRSMKQCHCRDHSVDLQSQPLRYSKSDDCFVKRYLRTWIGS